MEDNTMRSYNTRRRNFMKGVGGALAGVSVAGCLGGGEDADIEYWDTFNVQSNAARQMVEDAVSQFEEETDSTVAVNLSGFGQMSGAEWITNFEQGEYPVIFTGDQIAAGLMEEGGWILPFEEWKGELSEEVQAGIEWMEEEVQTAIKWMDEHPNMEEEILTFPVGMVPQEPFQVRVDHLEEAGLDPETDFPPENYDDLVEVATALTEDGPGEYGFQLTGHEFDWYTLAEPYTNALGGDVGEAGYFSDDYREVNFDTDTWREAIQGILDLYHEHEVSGPQTTSASDNDVLDLFINGQVSMGVMEPTVMPSLLNRGSDLVENGDVQWGEFWTEPSGINNAMLTYGIAITRAPDGADEEEWEQKQELAIELADIWFSEMIQTRLVQSAGFLPVRRDLWEAAAESMPHGDASGIVETMSNMVETSRGVHTSHPMYIQASSSMGEYLQRGFQGELTADEICEMGAEDGNEVLDEFWSARE